MTMTHISTNKKDMDGHAAYVTHAVRDPNVFGLVADEEIARLQKLLVQDVAKAKQRQQIVSAFYSRTYKKMFLIQTKGFVEVDGVETETYFVHLLKIDEHEGEYFTPVCPAISSTSSYRILTLTGEVHNGTGDKVEIFLISGHINHLLFFRRIIR